MIIDPPPPPCLACDAMRVNPRSMEALNRDCHCVAVAPEAMHEALTSAIGTHGLPSAFADSHPHLFAALPVYVSREHLAELARIVSAVQAAVALPEYQAAVLTWAPEIAQFDPGSPGGMLGLDFHIAPDGPRLIEINTNPGGALLNALLGQALRQCVPDMVTTPTDMAEAEQHVLQVMRQEWTRQVGGQPLASIAIVDEAPMA